MNPELAATVERVRAAFGEACFACGRHNPLGLRLDSFHLDDEGWVSAWFQPRPQYRGAGDTLHGGIAATALDELLVWAGILNEGVMSVTGTLDLRYRKPLTINDRIQARAQVEERRGRRLVLTGHLLANDAVAVEGRGVYLVSETVEGL